MCWIGILLFICMVELMLSHIGKKFKHMRMKSRPIVCTDPAHRSAEGKAPAREINHYWGTVQTPWGREAKALKWWRWTMSRGGGSRRVPIGSGHSQVFRRTDDSMPKWKDKTHDRSRQDEHLSWLAIVAKQLFRLKICQITVSEVLLQQYRKTLFAKTLKMNEPQSDWEIISAFIEGSIEIRAK